MEYGLRVSILLATCIIVSATSFQPVRQAADPRFIVEIQLIYGSKNFIRHL
jgi:hypothetical protein